MKFKSIHWPKVIDAPDCFHLEIEGNKTNERTNEINQWMSDEVERRAPKSDDRANTIVWRSFTEFERYVVAQHSTANFYSILEKLEQIKVFVIRNNVLVLNKRP